jgi:hypothetical protein
MQVVQPAVDAGDLAVVAAPGVEQILLQIGQPGAVLQPSGTIRRLASLTSVVAETSTALSLRTLAATESMEWKIEFREFRCRSSVKCDKPRHINPP